ncbi:MAG TPA: L,D-transpeptidase [Acidimicrobiales bacterium]
MGADLRALLLVATVAVAAACGGQGGSAPADGVVPPTPPTTATTAGPAPESSTSAPAADGLDAGTALVARPTGPVAVAPAPGAAPTLELPATTEFGSPRALLVVDRQDGWLQVALPERPNGSTGWIVDDGSVELREVDERIEIDLAARTLTLYDGGTEVLTTPVAIGSADAPTPTGDFYVVDKLATGDPDHAYGPFAFGLSAHSDVLTEFAGGDGQVGIHGTNDPASVGQAVSHGCIRVPNDVAVALDARLALGTPVRIG